ncbi:hypothetical protein JCM8547_005914 [Rhodosporidiobolus lusitaniae]
MSFQPCKDCIQGYSLDGEPKGHMEENGDGNMSYYLSPGKGSNGGEKKAIVLGTDMFGLVLNNPRIMADWFAATTGFDCFVPDLFDGDYIDTTLIKPQLDLMDEPMKPKPWYSRWSAMAQIIWTFLWKIGPSWIKKHSVASSAPRMERFCQALKEEKGYTHIGVLSTLLATAPSPIDVLVAVHPGSGAGEEHFKAIRKPFALILAEEDITFDSKKSMAISVLDDLHKTQSVPTIVHDDHPGTTHGFAARPPPQAMKEFERTLVQTKEWFDEHL